MTALQFSLPACFPLLQLALQFVSQFSVVLFCDIYSAAGTLNKPSFTKSLGIQPEMSGIVLSVNFISETVQSNRESECPQNKKCKAV